ncbi:unnamed protein product [Allacma fusca]|uniref:Uncharacterized protein n=1 Tax=Allacma fusca TaxID=39272 RepID=A0A8J2JJ00_9HEXA|nr:unnamed protein product [Allacma fusca]
MWTDQDTTASALQPTDNSWDREEHEKMPTFNILRIDAEPRTLAYIYGLGLTDIESSWGNFNEEDIDEQIDREDAESFYELPKDEVSIDLENCYKINYNNEDLTHKLILRATISPGPKILHRRFTQEILLGINLKSTDVFVTLHGKELTIYMKIQQLNTQGNNLEVSHTVIKKVLIPQHVITEKMTFNLKPGGIFVIDAPVDNTILLD